MANKPRRGSTTVRTGKGRRPKAVRSHHPVDPDEPVNQRPPRLSHMRSALVGRGHEFGGIALICTGILLSFSIYVTIAGPLGRGLNSSLSWLLGVGRFVMPVICITAGVAFIKRTEVQHRVRLAFGWSTVWVSILGLIHIVWGANDIHANLDALARAGGWLGALVGEPLRGMLSGIGATVVLLAVIVGGVLLITGKTLPELIKLIRTWVDGMSAETGASFVDHESNRDDSFDNPANEFGASERGSPVFYDIDLDEENEPRRVKRKTTVRRDSHGIAGPTFAPTKVVKGEAIQMPLGPGAQASSWALPTLDMLSVTRHAQADEIRIRQRGEVLVEALKEHGVETTLVGFTRGPTVTRYELSLGGGVKVAHVTSLSRDIAYTMAATDVRILAPIPGRSAIGIEVPNEQRELVSLGDLMDSQEARGIMHPLEVAIGKDISGHALFLNIANTPHLLIAGTTGAGKSSVLNCIITSVLVRSTPDQVRLILIDPKQVEMAQFARLPHLLTAPVTNPKKAANALGWAVKEMERRYDMLVEAGFRDVIGYNAAYDRGDLIADEYSDRTYERFPYILIVVDELNDLMMVAARDVEDCITRIAQKARAVGIHLIVATQRPSVNVITGVIKANIPARMAFAVSSLTDSRVILDQPGAEKLIGKGDMLLLPGNTSVSQRVQSAWVEESEVRKIVGHWRRQAPEIAYVSGIEGEHPSNNSAFGGTTGDSGDDELVRQAMDLVVRTQQGSTSMLQRKLKVGFARAGRIMDLLESRGVVGPSEGSKPREVLMTLEELEQLQRAS
ncbi:MAG: DNA translocase FtsK 4TM domain-containing protein [Ilumatobacteraceae bacterium]